MRTSTARWLSVLVLTLALALSTMATPAAAGNASGAFDQLERWLTSVDDPAHQGACAYVRDVATGNLFVGVRTNVGLAVTKFSGTPTSPATLPDRYMNCDFAGFIT